MTQSDGGTSSFASSDGQTVEAGGFAGAFLLANYGGVTQAKHRGLGRTSAELLPIHPELDRALSRAMAWLSPPMDRPSEEDRSLTTLEGSSFLQFVPIGITSPHVGGGVEWNTDRRASAIRNDLPTSAIFEHWGLPDDGAGSSEIEDWISRQGDEGLDYDDEFIDLALFARVENELFNPL